MDLARLYLKEKRIDDMGDVMMRSIHIYPTIQAYRTLGDIMMERGNAAGAAKFYEKMDGFAQSPGERLSNGLALSYAYVRAGDFENARVRLSDLLQVNPNFRPALELLRYVTARLEGDSTHN